MSEAIAPQDAQAAWKEVADERAGKPVVAVETPPIAKSAEPAAAETEPNEPEWRKHIADLESKIDGRMRKAEGHLGHLIGSQKELKALLEASQQARLQVGGDAPTQAQMQEAAFDPQKWADFKEQFPEFIGLLESNPQFRPQPAFDAEKFGEEIEKKIAGKAEEIQKKIVIASLSVHFPGWKKEVQSDEFRTWIGSQGAETQALLDSDEGEDAARVLSLYRESKQASPTNAITEQRKATLAAATAAPRGPQTKAVAKSYEDMTPAERWEHEKRIRAKQRQ